MNANGSHKIQIKTNPPDPKYPELRDAWKYRSPSWSPDGKRIIFVYGLPMLPDAGLWDIYTIDIDGSNQVKVTPGLDWDFYDDPSFSPNGNKIVYQKGCNLFIMNSDGTGSTQLTYGTLDEKPEWSPDGKKIVFSSLRQSVQDIFTVNPAGTNLTNLTNNPLHNFASDPTWSPDGSKIAFTSDGGLWIMNSDGTDAHYIPFVRELDYSFVSDPDWSPDGGKITFHCFEKIIILNINDIN